MNAGTRDYLIRQLTPERGFDLIRIYLGVGLMVRGVLFFLDPSFVGQLIDAQGATPMIPRLIALGHMLGGTLLALGLYTRVAAAVQVAPVLGALLMIHVKDNLASADQSLEFSALVLVMLVFFAAFGAGSWSLDARRRAPRFTSGGSAAGASAAGNPASGHSDSDGSGSSHGKMPLQQRQVEVGVDRELL